MRDLLLQAEELRALHFANTPLVLANVWDAASARAVEAAGHEVIATSSAAVAASLGSADHEKMHPDDAFAALRRIASAVAAPVTADIEAGYGLPAGEIAERLLEAGAVGCNLEDSDHHSHGTLLDARGQAERIHALCDAARTMGVALVVNARIDVYRHHSDPGAVERHKRTTEAIRRARMYLDAGATCIYPIGLSDEDEIALLVEELRAPINIWLRADTPSLATLARLGVARISLASGLQRAVMGHATELATSLRAGEDQVYWSTPPTQRRRRDRRNPP